ncbi:uncharacterized protein LOC129598506 isoform X2 [Paramacrobiotus metropolitanus]|nr:uncharacterized protein LOC129598506 isoform X2 [Paramacrobiotus metropolitanus]XP_055352426.1 uncharacterized protein LOC129598506 isoform X2 [Paramacrobiotus metropolitanus]XP_055352427.1 uncharacterized protein LOC129598506 isoform X2 [Paramacrobiotus metropolitanus]
MEMDELLELETLLDDECDVDYLPVELLQMILSALDTRRQQWIRRVCAKWNELICDPYGACHVQVRFEINSTGWIGRRTPRGSETWTFDAYANAITQLYARCVGVGTRDITFHPATRASSIWSFSGYCVLIEALRGCFKQLSVDDFVLSRLNFVGLTLPSVVMAWLYDCSGIVREVCLRNVTLVASLELSRMFVMEASINTTIYCGDFRNIDIFRSSRDDFAWAKYVAECAGALAPEQEQLVLNCLRSEDTSRKLSEELQDSDVAETFHNHFWGEFESLELEDISLEWLHKFDVWTLRFLFHYFVSVCDMRPVTGVRVWSLT